MPQRHPADSQELQDYYHREFEKIKHSWFSENNIDKKQADFDSQTYKADGEGNELL